MIQKATPVPKTVRKNRGAKDVSGTFGPEANESRKTAAVANILNKFEENFDKGGSANNKHTAHMPDDSSVWYDRSFR